MELPAPIGRMYVIRTPTDKQMKLVKLAFALVDRQFVFCTNAEELKRILEVKAGQGKPLSDGGNFRDALGAVAATGNMFLYVDMDRARPFLLDQRYQYAFDASFFNEQSYRRQVIIDLTKENPRWTPTQRQDAADVALDRRWVQAKQIDFPDAIRRFRNNMIWYEPFRWLALSLTPGGDTGREIRLDLKGAIRLEGQD